MSQEIVTAGRSLTQVFNKLTMPQALVIDGGLIFAALILNSAFKNGWAPDFDFASGRFRFNHYSQAVQK